MFIFKSRFVETYPLYGQISFLHLARGFRQTYLGCVLNPEKKILIVNDFLSLITHRPRTMNTDGERNGLAVSHK